MASLSSNCGFFVPTVNADGNLWGNELQATIGLWDTLLGGSLDLQSSAAMSVVLSSTQAQFSRIQIQGNLPTDFILTLPGGNFANGDYVVWNNSSAGMGNIFCQTTGGGAVCRIPPNTMRTVNVDGINAQFADNQPVTGFPAYQNKFRNPMMDVAQRGTTVGIVAGSSNNATLDGWQLNPPVFWPQTVNQIYNGNMSGNALRINGTGNTVPFTALQQNIESIVAVQMLGVASSARQQVTAKFDVFNNTSAAFTPQLVTAYCNSRDNFSVLTTDLAAVNLQSCPIGAVTTVAYSFLPSSNIGNGYQVALSFGGILNLSGGSIDISHCDFRVTSTAATGLVSNPPAVESRPYEEELAYCQRYFFQPPSGWWYTNWTTDLGGGAAGRDANFPATMRAAPAASGVTFTRVNCNVISPVGASSAHVQNAGGAPFYLVNTLATAAGMSAFIITGSFSAELSS